MTKWRSSPCDPGIPESDTSKIESRKSPKITRLENADAKRQGVDSPRCEAADAQAEFSKADYHFNYSYMRQFARALA